VTASILVVEDEPAIQELIAVNLSRNGHEVRRAATAGEALAAVAESLPDVILLDWMLPDSPGPTIARRLRGEPRTREVPIIMLTARAGDDDKVAGLESGADDYITKPFDFPELEARLRAVLRRSKPAGGGAELAAGSLRFDRQTRRAVVNGEPVELSPREAVLLDLLLTNSGNVVTKEQIAAAWAEDGNEVGIGNTAEVHIHRLRRKLESSGLVIRTVRGLGYLLETELLAGPRP